MINLTYFDGTGSEDGLRDAQLSARDYPPLADAECQDEVWDALRRDAEGEINRRYNELVKGIPALY